MKLTKHIREEFVRSAMNDVPTIDYKQQITDIVRKAVIDDLPPKVRACWDDPSTNVFIKTTWNFYAGVSVTHPWGHSSSNHNLNDKASKTIEALKIKDDAQSQLSIDLRSKLSAAANSVTTRKALVAILPEFEKYLPDDEAAACRTLPAIANVVADFTKAGWPKGAAKK